MFKKKIIRFGAFVSVPIVASYLYYKYRQKVLLRTPYLPEDLHESIELTQNFIKKNMYMEALNERHKAYKLKNEKYEGNVGPMNYFVNKSFISIAISLGDLAFKNKNYNDAYGFYVDALKNLEIIEKPGSNAMIVILLKIADILHKQEKHLEAQEGYKACIYWLTEYRPLEHIDDYSLLALVYKEYGIFLGDLARFDDAIQLIEKSLDIKIKDNDFSELEFCEIQNLLGVLNTSSGEYKTAFDIFCKILDKNKTCNIESLIPTVLYNIGYLLTKEDLLPLNE